MSLLRLVVVSIDLGTELLFLDNRHLLVTAGFTGLLRSLVLELAEVHEFADRWAGLRRNLDQVEVRFLSQPQRVLDADDAYLLTIRTN